MDQAEAEVPFNSTCATRRLNIDNGLFFVNGHDNKRPGQLLCPHELAYVRIFHAAG